MHFKSTDVALLLGCASLVSAAPAAPASDLTAPISLEAAAAHYSKLEARQFGGFSLGGLGGSSTSNDIKEGKCAPLTWIFARGSTEPGNMGASVGPSVASHLQEGGDVAVQGVDYTASIASNAMGGRPGGQAMAALIQETKQKCPDTKIAIGGYSQGGMVTHIALGLVNEGDVDAAITYGDPYQRSDFKNIDQSRTQKFCNPADGVCKTGGFAITPGHLTYTTNGDTKAGADFIRSVVGVGSGGSSTSAASPTTASSTTPSSDTSSEGSSLGGLASMLGGGGMSGSSTESSADSASSSTSSSSTPSSSSSSSGLSSMLGGGSLGSLSSLGGGMGSLGSLSSLGGGSGSSSLGGGMGSLGSLSSLGGGGSGLSSLGGGMGKLSSLSSFGGGGGSGLSKLGSLSSGFGGMSGMSGLMGGLKKRFFGA